MTCTERDLYLLPHIRHTDDLYHYMHGADVTVMGTLLHSTCKESFLGVPQAKKCGRFLIAQQPGMAVKIKQ